MRITLTVTAGPHEGKIFTFEGHDTFLVGRGPEAHFRLPREDRYFSRLHFLVESNPPSCRLQDLGSRNGTYVNSTRVARADLRHGDIIRGGRTELRVAVEAAAITSAATRLPAVDDPYATQTRTALPKLQPDASGPLTAVCPMCGCPSPETSAPPLCPDCRAESRKMPQLIAGYRLVRELGRGGMGVVYLAVREADGSMVALKMVIPAMAGSRIQIERFLREADILRQLDHSNIVRFREVGESGGRLYFAMDFVRGTDADRLVEEHGPLPVDLAMQIVCQLLAALEYAHARKFVHRDVKPSNVMLTEDAAGQTVVKLADFGLARVYQASQLSGLTLTGDVGGTPAYMPPEFITDFRNAIPASDQYGAAAMLYFLLAGRPVLDLPPWPKAMFVILDDAPVPLRERRPDMPQALAAAVHRALAKAPGDRFVDVAAFRQALLPFGQ